MSTILKSILLNLLRAIVSIGAAVVAYFAMMVAMEDRSMHFVAVLGMQALALCFMIRIRWGIIRIALCVMAATVYFFAVVLMVFCEPLFVLQYGLVPIITVLVMLKKTDWWVKLMVAIVFLIAAIYCWFVNDILDPLEFSTRDSVINTPSLWIDSYQFYWLSSYLCDLVWTAGVPSAALLLVYHLYRLSETCKDWYMTYARKYRKYHDF